MSNPDLIKEIDRDLQRAPANRVVYLEGKTDVDIFFALLGLSRPQDDVANGVLIRGLRDGSAGSRAVELRVGAARSNGRPHVYGFTDGDGRDLAELDALFHGPGPLFAWRGYSIESLLVRAGWPSALGDAPDWPAVLRGYSALVALNRLGARLRRELEDHQLHRFLKPRNDIALHDRHSVRKVMEQARSVVARDLAVEFDQLADRFEAMVDSDLEAAHTWLDGKWLLDHHVGGVLRKPSCRDPWVAHVVANGGLPEVVTLWERIRR